MLTAPSLITDLASHGALGAAVGIVLFSYLLEDGALILAAVLASTGILSPLVAWSAAFFGIFTGDLGVYFIARFFHKPVARWRPDIPMPSTKELVLCRFTPGLRTIAFSWCGLSKMPVLRFSQIIFWSGLAWTIPVFSLIYWGGNQTSRYFTHLNWLLIPAILLMMWWWRHHWTPSFLRRESVSHD